MRRVGYLAGPAGVAISAIVLLLCATAAGCANTPIVLADNAGSSILRVEHAPSLGEIRALYPAALQRQDVVGLVLVRMTIDPAGRVIQTKVLKEEPGGIGLGAAAESLAHQFKFANASHRSVVTTLPVRFMPSQWQLRIPPVHSRLPIQGCNGNICQLNSG